MAEQTCARGGPVFSPEKKETVKLYNFVRMAENRLTLPGTTRHRGAHKTSCGVSSGPYAEFHLETILGENSLNREDNDRT